LICKETDKFELEGLIIPQEGKFGIVASNFWLW